MSSLFPHRESENDGFFQNLFWIVCAVILVPIVLGIAAGIVEALFAMIFS